MEPVSISRAEAKAKSLKRYFTGNPCKNGHVAQRQVSNGCCVTCQQQRVKEWLVSNKDIAVAAQKRWSKKNKEKHLEVSRQWKKKNPAKTAFNNSKRKAAKKQRCPSWLTEDDWWFINELYDLAALRTKATGVKWHVDHIIPLLGKGVSGLHVPSNLRVIPASENMSKGNRYIT